MLIRIEAVAKQLVYPGAAILTRWQADTMNDNQTNRAPLWALVKIGGWHLPCCQQGVS